MRDPEDAAIRVLRAGAPKVRSAAFSAWRVVRVWPTSSLAWRCAIGWSWLAWRLTARVWLVNAAEAAGVAVGLLVVAVFGLSLACYAAARGFGGLALDGWRWLWRRD